MLPTPHAQCVYEQDRLGIQNIEWEILPKEHSVSL